MIPRSMFKADGSMKTSLMSILEGCTVDLHSELPDPSMDTDLTTAKKDVLVDAKGDVQSMGKPDTFKTCSELADNFESTVWRNTTRMMKYD